MLEAFAIAGAHACVGVDVETSHLGAALAGDRGLAVHVGGAQTNHPAAAMGSGCDQPLHGGVRQVIEQGGLSIVDGLVPDNGAADLSANGTRDARDIFVGWRRQRMKEQPAIALRGVHAIQRQGVKVDVQSQC